MNASCPARAVAFGCLLVAACGLLAACAAPPHEPLPASLLTSPQSSWEHRSRRRTVRTEEEKEADPYVPMYEVAVGGSGYIWDEFSLGRLHNERWDSSGRIDVALRYHPEPGPKYDPVVGIYGYYEKRKWDDGAADVDYRSYGIGADLAMSVAPGGPPKKGDRRPRLTYFPYARLGIGGQGGEFENVPQKRGTFSSGDFDEVRGEAQVGFDIRVHFGELVGVSLGIGGDIWGSLPYDAVTRDSSSAIVDDDDSLWAWGWGVFGKVGLSIKF